MLEKNNDKLAKLLQDLPVYQPPDRVWQALDHSLPKSAPSGLDRLPQYDPPDRVWNRIEANLPKVSRRPLRYAPWLAAAAAAIAAIIWFFPTAPAAERTDAKVSGLSYSREVVDEALLQRDWEEDAESFDLINRLCASSSFTCANPDMQTLQMELEELTTAKEALEKALGKYGADPDMIAQLAQIERRRTALLKRMLDYFL